MADSANKIFLAEFVVRRIQLQNSLCSDEFGSHVWDLGKMWVVFRIPSCPTVEICETNWIPKEEPVFNAAKSVLFGLSDEQIDDVTNFHIDVGVLKKMPSGVVPGQVFVGHTILDLTEEFDSLIESICDKNCTLPQTREVEHQLILTGSKAVGTISVLIRFTCFGAMIVSKFKQNLKDYIDKDFIEEQSEINICTGNDGEPCWTKDDGNQKTDIGSGVEYRSNFCSGVEYRSNFGSGENKPSESIGSSKPNIECDEFEEIEAIMNGHGFTIRVPKHSKKSKFDYDCRCNPLEDPKECHCTPPPKDGVNVFAREEEDGNLLVEIPGDCQTCSLAGDANSPQAEQCYVIKKSNSQGNTIGLTNLDMKMPMNISKDACLMRISKKNRTNQERTQYLFEIQTPQPEDPPKEMVSKTTQYLDTDLPREEPAQSAKKNEKGKEKGNAKGKKGKKRK